MNADTIAAAIVTTIGIFMMVAFQDVLIILAGSAVFLIGAAALLMGEKHEAR